MPAPLLYETHCHTPLCKHARGEPEEYAAAAAERGLKGIIFTCHNPMPDGFSSRIRMGLEEFPQYVQCVQRARLEWQGRVDVRLGLEADYFPGYEPFLKEQLESAEFHYVLGSVHPHTAEYRAEFYSEEDPLLTQRRYFEHLATAAETGLFDCLSHPDLIKNEMPHLWDAGLVMDDILRALDRIAATGVAMELNTSGANKIVPEMNPFPGMLQEMAGREIPVVIGADAHDPGRVGEHFETALETLTDCGYREVSLFLDRQRQAIEITDALASLRFQADEEPMPEPRK